MACCCRLICASLSKPHTVSSLWEALRPTWRGFYELDWKHHQMCPTVPLQRVQDGERTDSHFRAEDKVQLDFHVLVCLDWDSSGGTVLCLPLAITGMLSYFWPKTIIHLQENVQVAEFGGTLGLFIGFSFISLWDTAVSSFHFIKHFWDENVTRK